MNKNDFKQKQEEILKEVAKKISIIQDHFIKEFFDIYKR